MKLTDVLKKTREKVAESSIKRIPPSIAQKDRPYNLQENKSFRDEVRIEGELKSEENREQSDSKLVANCEQSDSKLVANCEQSDSKLVANREQSDSKLVANREQSDSKLVANREQSDSKLVANREQSDSKLVANREQSDSKLVANREQSDSKLVANREQSDSKLVAKPTAKKGGFSHLSEITGHQKNLLIFLYQECKKARMENTEALTLEYISSCTKIGKSVVKNSLYRLENKNCIGRKEYKNGRGGWTKYTLQDDIFRDLLQLENDHQLSKIREEMEEKLVAKPTANFPLSSSISSISSTTREESLKNYLPEMWDDLEIDNLSKIGFTKDHLLQLSKIESLNAAIVQDSINAFVFDLDENDKAEKIKGSPLNYFMGILRRGMPYLAPENYEPLETKTMRIYLEQKERQREQKLELEKKAFDLAFEEWMETLSQEKISDIIPEPHYRSKDNPFHKGALSLHFQKNVWNKNLSLLPQSGK